jgi:hypothetical protein
MSGADLYEITVDGASCCAAVERVGDTALCKELLAPKGLALKAAARLAVVLPASGYQLRSPWGEDGSWQALPLGMAHPLTTPGVAVRTALGAYMGLAFD